MMKKGLIGIFFVFVLFFSMNFISSIEWEIDSYTYDNISISPQDGDAKNIFWKLDGTKMYECGSASGGDFYQYSCSDAWNLSSCSYDNVTMESQGVDPRIFFNSSGTRFWEISANEKLIYEYDCSTAWDLSSCSHNDNNLSIGGLSPSTLYVKEDGSRFYFPDSTINVFKQYSCTNGWDITSCSYDVNISSDSTPYSIFFKPDGTKFYEPILSNKIYQYSCSDAWNLSSCNSDGTNLTSPGTRPTAIFFKSDGLELYITDPIVDKIYQLSTEEDSNETSTNQSGFWNLTGTYLYPSSLDYFVGIGTATPRVALDVIGTIFAGDGSLRLGTQDAYGRYQIWNFLPASVLRLGSLSADGDAQTIASQGIVVYGNNSRDDAMSSSNYGWARIKPNRIALHNGINGTQSDYFRMDPDGLYLKDDSHVKTFEIIRESGLVNTESGYSVNSQTGITNNTGFWMCKDSACSTTCQVDIKGGIIVGCA